MPQPIYGWVNAKQGKSRTRPLPDYKQAITVIAGQLVMRPNLPDTKGPIWDGMPPQ